MDSLRGGETPVITDRDVKCRVCGEPAVGKVEWTYRWESWSADDSAHERLVDIIDAAVCAECGARLGSEADSAMRALHLYTAKGEAMSKP